MTVSSDQKGSGKDQRAERLAEALRENLRRRKAQARSRRGGRGIGEQGDSGQGTGHDETDGDHARGWQDDQNT